MASHEIFPEREPAEQKNSAEHRAERDALRPEVYPGIALIPELDIASAITELQNNGQLPSVKRTFELTGTHRETGVEDTSQFEITIERRVHFPPEQSVEITVRSIGGFKIPVFYSSKDRSASVGSTDAGIVSGYGYYSVILANLLKDIDTTENNVNNSEIHYIRAEEAEETPHSVLAALSPVGASRKGFIVFLDGTGSHLTGIRVPPAVDTLLREAVDVERGKPGRDPHVIADDLEALSGGVDDAASYALQVQIRHLRQKSR